MYTITIDDKYIVQDSIDNVVMNPQLVEKLNGAGSLSFSIPYNDDLINYYQERRTSVEVKYNERVEFRGRLLNIDKKFDGSKTLEFEGDLAFLNDIQYPSYDFAGDYDEFFRNIIDYYNSKCDNDKQFIVGQVTMTDANKYIVRSSESYSSCWEVIDKKILDYGGYLKIRYVNGKRYIDLLAESGEISNQKVEFGKNILDLENYIDTTNIATVLIPLGASEEDCKEKEDGVERTFTTGKLDIRNVNDGKDYIESQLVEMYGRVEVVEEWEDVTIPSNLLSKAKKRLNELIMLDQSITAKVVDLHFSNEDIAYFRIGNVIPIVSKPHDIDITAVLVERTRNLNNPAEDTITLGTERKTLSSSVNDTNTAVSDTVDKVTGNFINNAIKNQTKLLADGKFGYCVYGFNNQGKLSEIYFMDTNNIATANNVMRLNMNGLGFSNDGFYGTYRNAWTIDGTLNADFINAGQLSCNFINGGVLRLGNVVNRDGRIEIYNEKGRLVSTYDKDGIKIFNENGNSIVMNDVEFAGYDSAGNVIFTVQNDKFVMNKAEINTQIDIAKRVRLMYVNDEETGSEGIGIVPII